MISKLLYKLIVALAVIGAVSSVGPPATPAGAANAGQGQTGTPASPADPSKPGEPDPALPEVKIDPPSSNAMKIMDQLGLTKKARSRLPPIYIPKDLSGKTDAEIMSYANMLMVQRRALQRRMTRYMAYTAFLMALLQVFGTSGLVKGLTAGLFWLNNNYRATINADWMIHQEQLGEFILEYMREKDVKFATLSKSRIVGRPMIRLPYAEKEFVEFPVWLTEKGQSIPKDSEIGAPLPLLRNWWAKK